MSDVLFSYEGDVEVVDRCGPAWFRERQEVELVDEEAGGNREDGNPLAQAIESALCAGAEFGPRGQIMRDGKPLAAFYRVAPLGKLRITVERVEE